jgi:hypothetical protein
MSSSLVPHPSLHPLPSQVVEGTTDLIQSTEQIEARHADLTEVYPHTLERDRQDDEHLLTIQEYEKQKENENDEAKVVESMQRECV